MAELILEKRLFDYLGLGIKGLPERWLAYPKDIGLMLVLLQGMGPDGAKLVNVDVNGNLQVTTAGQAGTSKVTVVRSVDSTEVTMSGAGDAQANQQALWMNSTTLTYNGVTTDRLRSASAANLIAQSGLGAALATPPGQWSVTSQPAAGSQATASRAAGGAGVRHVLTGFGFSAASTVAPVLTFLNVVIRDGATGAGTVLKQIAIVVLAATGQNVAPFEVGGLSVVGSANTAMTAEFSAGLANLSQGVSVQGYDAS